MPIQSQIESRRRGSQYFLRRGGDHKGIGMYPLDRGLSGSLIGHRNPGAFGSRIAACADRAPDRVAANRAGRRNDINNFMVEPRLQGVSSTKAALIIKNFLGNAPDMPLLAGYDEIWMAQQRLGFEYAGESLELGL